ncbi:nuclease SbcCD subunit D [Galliscardovia ingluviei]|uniref:Nuclease SbcCD subunit D n=2 Tax=Galliscardovia ingluviei TaxID=1769422 RepID=A0A8J3AMA4_9BIFI|nr:nuclease SbcCD subunit D [Galliscardovia ingluviei]
MTTTSQYSAIRNAMKILHTSDWHIGRRFKGVDMQKWQQHALDWLISYIEQEHIQVLLVSGDVYDVPRPSAQSVQLLSSVLNRITQLTVDGRPVEVVITPGNHDSALRLGFADQAFVPQLHMRWNVRDIAKPVIVERDHEITAVYALPYLDPDAYRADIASLIQEYIQQFDDIQYLPMPYGVQIDDETVVHVDRSHDAMMSAALTLMMPSILEQRAKAERIGKAITVIVMAHAFVRGALPADSERNIAIGGVQSVASDLFIGSGIDYLALGHLHRAQQVRIDSADITDSSNTDTQHVVLLPQAKLAKQWCEQHGVKANIDSLVTPIARYSGSLLAYSFSERVIPAREGNNKSVVILNTESGVDATNAKSKGKHGDTCDQGEMCSSRIVVEHLEPVQSGQPALSIVEGKLQDVLNEAEQHSEHWVSARVHVDEYPRGLYEQLDHYYQYVLEKTIIYDRTASSRSAPRLTAERDAAQDSDILDSFVQDMLGRKATVQERDVLHRALERALAQGRAL